MSTSIIVLQLVAIAALAVSVAESFRERAWWPRPVGRSPGRPPPRGSAPRQRRWLHAGLAAVLIGNVINGVWRPDTDMEWLVVALLLVAGVVLTLVGLVRRPSEAELRRYHEEIVPADEPDR